MKILVLSCDKNEDLWEPFHHCMEKYWPGHPEVIYSTETKGNPYYKTICVNCPLNIWSKRVRLTANIIDDNILLVLVDDIFIREPVDVESINYLCENFSENIACFNLEKQFDKNDLNTNIRNMKKRNHGSDWELSIMCGIWSRDKFIKILEKDQDPWSVEINGDTKGFDYYINSGDFIINWGYQYGGSTAGVMRGKWCKEVVPFFKKEGINVNYNIRGFHD